MLSLSLISLVNRWIRFQRLSLPSPLCGWTCSAWPWVKPVEYRFRQGVPSRAPAAGPASLVQSPLNKMLLRVMTTTSGPRLSLPELFSSYLLFPRWSSPLRVIGRREAGRYNSAAGRCTAGWPNPGHHSPILWPSGNPCRRLPHPPTTHVPPLGHRWLVHSRSQSSAIH